VSEHCDKCRKTGQDQQQALVAQGDAYQKELDELKKRMEQTKEDLAMGGMRPSDYGL
jgi:hypothetical protein